MYFLIKKDGELQIVPVPAEKEDAFHKQYDPRILSEGITIAVLGAPESGGATLALLALP